MAKKTAKKTAPKGWAAYVESWKNPKNPPVPCPSCGVYHHPDAPEAADCSPGGGGESDED